MSKTDLINVIAKSDCENACGRWSHPRGGRSDRERGEEAGRFSFPGFGIFTVKARAAHKGRNPQTGEPIKIRATKSVKFKRHRR